MHESSLQLTDEQKRAFIEAKVKRFRERYDEVVAETGMELTAVVMFDAVRGLYPDLAVVPKQKPAE